MAKPEASQPAPAPETAPNSNASLGRLSRMLAPMPIKPEQLSRFGTLPGADEEPWDVMLAEMALDEKTALYYLDMRMFINF